MIALAVLIVLVYVFVLTLLWAILCRIAGLPLFVGAYIDRRIRAERRREILESIERTRQRDEATLRIRRTPLSKEDEK